MCCSSLDNSGHDHLLPVRLHWLQHDANTCARSPRAGIRSKWFAAGFLSPQGSVPLCSYRNWQVVNKFYLVGITGSASLVMLVMTQVVRDSSISIIASARIIGAHALLQPRLCSRHQALTQQSRTLTHHGHLWLCWSTPANCVPLVSSSRKCFLQHLRELHVVASEREERDCEVLRVWVLKGSFCQWMMTLNSGRSRCEWIIPLFYTEIENFPNKFVKKKNYEGCPTPPRWWGWKLC